MGILNPDQPTIASHSPVLDAIAGIDFPVSLPRLKLYAQERGADMDVIATIDGMPDRVYTTLREINAVLGVHESVEGHENIWSPAGSAELEGESRQT